MPDLDPITQVYNALWQLYSSRLTGEKINYSFNDPNYIPKPIRFNEEHDLTVELLVENGNIKISSSSSGSELSVRFTWMFKANDLRVNKVFLPALFTLYRTLCGWREIVGALTWNGKTFAKRLQDIPIQTGIDQKLVGEDRPTILTGWTAVLSHSVDMYFTRTDLEDFSINPYP